MDREREKVTPTFGLKPYNASEYYPIFSCFFDFHFSTVTGRTYASLRSILFVLIRFVMTKMSTKAAIGCLFSAVFEVDSLVCTN